MSHRRPVFERRVITLAPGTSRPFDTADWADALVVLECGEVELEALSGCRVRLQPGAIFWLAGLPLRALHNLGCEPAVLVAVSRVRPSHGHTMWQRPTLDPPERSEEVRKEDDPG